MIPGAEPTVYEEVPDLEKLKVRFGTVFACRKWNVAERY